MDDPTGARPLAAATRFSPTEAAFTGFRVLQREPLTGVIWAGMLLVMGVVFGALSVLLAGPAMVELMQLSAETEPDPAATAAVMARMAPFYLIIFPLSLLFYAVAIAAVTRAVLRPDEPRGFGRLKLGGDELRQLGVILLFSLVVFGAYIALAIVAVIVVVAGGLALGVSATAGAAGPAAGGVVLLTMVLGLGALAAMTFLVVRLSLACPLSFDTGKVDLFGSWRLTKGRFWPLLGAYLLCFLLVFLLTLTAFIVTAVLGVFVGGGLSAAGAVFRPDMSSLSAYFTPVILLWVVVSSAVNAVALALVVGAPAGAYAQLRALTAPALAEPPVRGF